MAARIPGWLAALGYAGVPISLLLFIFRGGGLSLLTLGYGVPAARAAEVAGAGEAIGTAVGNQLVNAFANDDCSGAAATTTDWRDPGVGRTVSPDDIAWFWSRPQGIDSAGNVRGLYGTTVRAAVRMARMTVRYEAQWKEVPYYGGVLGVVRRDRGDGPKPVAGATVYFACRTFTTAADGSFGQSQGVPGGIYLVAASYTDPETGYVWEIPENDPLDVNITNGPPVSLDITLAAPPAAYRHVTLHWEIDVVDRTTIGEDEWEHGKDDVEVGLGPFDPTLPESYDAGRGPEHPDNAGKYFWTKASIRGGDATCEFTARMQWRDTHSIDVSITSCLFSGDDEIVSRTDTVTIPPEAWRTLNISLDGGGIEPKRGWIRLHFTNVTEG